MRSVFLASVTTLLVLLLATSAYPHFEQGSAAVEASGDITLNFGIHHEIDFEVRDNYDLDNGLTDGCTRAAITGNDCSGSAANRDGFVHQETRLIVEGSQGDVWKARVMLESDENWGGGERFTLGTERAWADVKLIDNSTLGHVRVRAGLFEEHFWDPFQMVWSGDDTGVKLYGFKGSVSWALWWFKTDDVANASSTATSGRDGDQDYYLARMDLDFGPFQVIPALGYLRNRSTTEDARFAVGHPSQDNWGCANFRKGGHTHGPLVEEDSCSANTDGVTVDEDVLYPGVSTKGKVGPVSWAAEVFGAFGEIGDGSAVDAQRDQDVAAYMVAGHVGVSVGAWTPHVGFIFLSGDDNPHDGDAEAWAAISPHIEETFPFGPRGILADDTVQVLNIGHGSLESTEDGTTARQYFTQPGLIVLAAGLLGRPSKKIKTTLNVLYYQWDMEKQWEYVDGMVTTVNCTPSQTASQQGTCSNDNFTNGVADGSGLVSTVDDEVGWELNGSVSYYYTPRVWLTVSAAVFWPGDGAEVVAQCANAAGGGWLLAGGGHGHEAAGGTGASQGCGDGINISTVSGIARADDEAFNIEAELMVHF
ncbi:MAG: hypothetical protein RX316_01800 [bacterium]|nr:hypothetical protein [bacterium]